ncbi:MAG TPA: S53 family peptidase [Bryobacteraceae bacterium]
METHPAPDQSLEITCVLRRRKEISGAPELKLSHEELAQMHGADPAHIEAIEAFAAMHFLSVIGVNAGTRTIVLAGPLDSLTEVFGAGVEGSLRIPESLADKVIAVLGFDERSTAASYHQQWKPHAHCFFPNRNAHSFTPVEVAQAYQFPPNKGKNQTIALIELGGGFKTSDLSAYWKQMGVNSVETIAVSVDGVANQPTGDPSGPDGEVALDIEVAGAVAPEARLAVYFAPNTDRGFLDAINAAIHDTVHKPSVISISWGAPENQWTPQTMNAFNAAFQDAALLGITVCAASGDKGSSDGESDGAAHVDFPASSPWVLACGGTRLIAKGDKIQSETAWNDHVGGATGGGVSAHFSKPSYQAAIPLAGRGVPDVAANADPASAYQILVDGKTRVVGGTSAVAPLWAGLIALLNEQLGKNLGWLHPTLYGTIAQHKAFNDVTSGTNEAYSAQTGWDACTGLGSPNGQAILDVLKQAMP